MVARYRGLTARLDLPHIVTGKPARLAVKRALPPATFLLPSHQDHVAFAERQLVLVVLLEVKSGLHHLLAAATPAVLRHLLVEHGDTGCSATGGVARIEQSGAEPYR